MVWYVEDMFRYVEVVIMSEPYISCKVNIVSCPDGDCFLVVSISILLSVCGLNTVLVSLSFWTVHSV